MFEADDFFLYSNSLFFISELISKNINYPKKYQLYVYQSYV
mgnify:CR=1 FL=1